jgi:hypothetical protein
VKRSGVLARLWTIATTRIATLTPDMFDRTRYLTEMHALVDEAIAALRQRHPHVEIYTVGIWTDPESRASTVSVDTAAHSAAFVAETEEYEARQHARFLAEGDHEQAALFAPRSGGRCTNPADFALREVATCDHASFPESWESATDGDCWQALGPALLEVRDHARARFRSLALHPDARLGVSSADDWFDHETPLARG